MIQGRADKARRRGWNLLRLLLVLKEFNFSRVEITLHEIKINLSPGRGAFQEPINHKSIGERKSASAPKKVPHERFGLTRVVLVVYF